MAVALPPPAEPQMVPAAEIRPYAKLKVQAGALTFYVADFCKLGTAQVARVASAATTPAEIVRGLGASCYLLGYPAALTRYGVDGSTLYIEVQRGRISSVEAPPRIKAYFAGIEKKRVVTAADLEKRRVLADSLSERAGDNYQMQLVPDGPDSSKLVIANPTDGRDRLQLRAGFATNGNRYSGRYIADGQARYSWGDGTEALIGIGAAVRPPQLRDDQSGPYHEASGSLTRVTTAGVLGVDGRYVELKPKVPAIDAMGTVFPAGLDGEISEAGVSWLVPLHATYTERVTLSLRVARVQQTFDFDDQRLLTERYTKANIVVSGATRFAIADSHVFELQGGVDLSQGFTSSPFVPAGGGGRGQFSMARPAIRLSYQPGAAFSPAIEASAQFTSAALPQNEQVVLGGDTQRAFEPGTAAGDQGWRAKATINHRPWALGWLSLEPTLFAEYGTARFRDPPPVAAGTAERAAVGLEATLRLGNTVEFTGFVAEPILASGPSLLADDERRLGARLSITY